MQGKKTTGTVQAHMLSPVNTIPAISRFPIGYNTGVHSRDHRFSQSQMMTPSSSGIAGCQVQKTPQSTQIMSPMAITSQRIKSTPTTAPGWMGFFKRKR